jgi:hypothetical protein
MYAEAGSVHAFPGMSGPITKSDSLQTLPRATPAELARQYQDFMGEPI